MYRPFTFHVLRFTYDYALNSQTPGVADLSGSPARANVRGDRPAIAGRGLCRHRALPHGRATAYLWVPNAAIPAALEPRADLPGPGVGGVGQRYLATQRPGGHPAQCDTSQRR